MWKVTVDKDKCTGDAECVDVCPVDCIPLDPAHEETKEQLLEKYHRLMAQSA